MNPKKRHKWVRAVSTYDSGRVSIAQACSVCGIFKESNGRQTPHYYNPENKSFPWSTRAGECKPEKKAPTNE